MGSYILKRLMLVIPTLLGIMTLNFFIIQAAPGGPVEQMIAKLEGVGAQGEVAHTQSIYKNQGLDAEMIAKINALYGLDKPLLERYFLMLKNYLTCFGTKSKIIFPMLAKIFAILLFDGFQFYILFSFNFTFCSIWK